MTVRALIVDDEPVARRRIRRLLKTEPDIEIIGEAGDGATAVAAIQAARPDLVFLDVQMPEKDGFAVLEALRPRAVPVVIFVTAHDQYALRAFDVHALDYLLKPVSADRFRAALGRARERLTERAAGGTDARLLALVEQLKQDRRYLQRLAVKSGGGIVLVDTAEIDFIRTADNYVLVHATGREYLLRETMNSLEGQLDPEIFVRIHRCALVRIDRVRELRPSFHGDFVVVLRDDTRLTLSRGYRERVEQILRKPL